MAKEKILVVDDEEDILELIRYNLINEGYRVDCAASGEEALIKAAEQSPDLILLDLMLPGLDGLDVCRELKANSATRQIPVIMITAKGEDADIVSGLELGAEDYVTKPFSPRILLARVKVVLRRKKNTIVEEEPVMRRDDLTIDPSRHEVRLEGKPLGLTTTEFRILLSLAENPGRVFSRDQIVNLVQGYDFEGYDRTIDAHVKNLRHKVEKDSKEPEFIKTVYGIGYKFIGTPDEN